MDRTSEFCEAVWRRDTLKIAHFISDIDPMRSPRSGEK